MLLSTPTTIHASPVTSADISTSVQDDNTSSTPQRRTSATPRSSASSLLAAQDEPQPALSTSAIAGIAVGSLLALTLVGVVVSLLRRRKRNPHPLSQPIYEPGNSRIVREKAGLNEQYSDVGVGGPVGVAELDGGSPMSPVMEPVHLSISERRTRVAQNSGTVLRSCLEDCYAGCCVSLEAWEEGATLFISAYKTVNSPVLSHHCMNRVSFV